MIQYLASIGRADLSTLGSTMATFMKRHGTTHVQAAKYSMRYLAGTKNLCLFFDGKVDDPTLHAYADANLANTPPFRSTTGYIVKTHGGVVAWKSGRQATATDSTMAAEIQAVTTTLKEVLFCRYLLRQLQEHLPHLPILSAEPTVIFNDNAGAVRHSNDHVSSSKSKHIDRQQHFTMDYVKSKQVAVLHVGTKDNLADGFTKPLDLVAFPTHLRGLQLEEHPAHGGA